jgi:two-component system OmpR family response regulator
LVRVTGIVTTLSKKERILMSQASKRVLIVDDNEMASELLAEFLELCGYEARVSHTGADAMTVADQFSPDIVIVDIMLPDTDGYALAGQFRKRAGATPTIVALSGLPKNMRGSDAAVFDAWLEKPADLDALEALLAKG